MKLHFLIPKFDGSRIAFTRFIKCHQDIFDDLLYSGKYYLTLNFNNPYVYEAYKFFINFRLGDDADLYCLMEDLNAFNNDETLTDINDIINEFEKWLAYEKTQQYFQTKLNIKMKNAINEKIENMEQRRRTIERTMHFKLELLDIDYMPYERENSIKGKLYRIIKKEFNYRNSIDYSINIAKN
jgi:hypothetical protein